MYLSAIGGGVAPSVLEFSFCDLRKLGRTQYFLILKSTGLDSIDIVNVNVSYYQD